jgi:hypothetical protein
VIHGDVESGGGGSCQECAGRRGGGCRAWQAVVLELSEGLPITNATKSYDHGSIIVGMLLLLCRDGFVDVVCLCGLVVIR